MASNIFEPIKMQRDNTPNRIIEKDIFERDHKVAFYCYTEMTYLRQVYEMLFQMDARNIYYNNYWKWIIFELDGLQMSLKMNSGGARLEIYGEIAEDFGKQLQYEMKEVYYQVVQSSVYSLIQPVIAPESKGVPVRVSDEELIPLVNQIIGLLVPKIIPPENAAPSRRRSATVVISPESDSVKAEEFMVAGSIEKTSSSSLEQSESSGHMVKVNINQENEMNLVRNLGIIAIQARNLIQERETKGPFVNYEDFSQRSGLPERISEKIRGQLDFTLPAGVNSQGRILEF